MKSIVEKMVIKAMEVENNFENRKKKKRIQRNRENFRD